MAKYYPKGAIKSVEEFLLLCKKHKTFYTVDDDKCDPGGVISKVKVYSPFIKRNVFVFVDSIGGRHLETCNLQKGNALWINNFIFANYWHALAYSMKCKQRQMEAADD
jgi:hypothetical protein